MGAIKIIAFEPFKACVGNINVNNSTIIRGLETGYGRSDEEKPIHRFGIPHLKEIREEPETDSGRKKRAQNQEECNLEMVFFICAQS